MALPLADGVLHLSLQRWYSDPEAKSFGEQWTTLDQPEHRVYHDLMLAFNGIINVKLRGSRKDEHYAAFRIHQPEGGPLHNLGLIVASTMVHRRERIPIDPELATHMKTAVRRLYTLAANSPETEGGKQYETIADNATKQEYITSDSYEPENGYRILDAAGARQLRDTLRFAMLYGEDLER